MDIGDIYDDEIEQLLVYVRSMARAKLYDTEIPPDGADAMRVFNFKVAEARMLLRRE